MGAEPEVVKARRGRPPLCPESPEEMRALRRSIALAVVADLCEAAGHRQPESLTVPELLELLGKRICERSPK